MSLRVLHVLPGHHVIAAGGLEKACVGPGGRLSAPGCRASSRSWGLASRLPNVAVKRFLAVWHGGHSAALKSPALELAGGPTSLRIAEIVVSVCWPCLAAPASVAPASLPSST